MPFGNKLAEVSGKAIEIDFDYVYNSIIRPAGIEAGWTVSRIDEVTRSGIISDQYLKEILESELVLADISSSNSNVFYELGIRQSISTGGTILLAIKGSKIPFDLSSQRIFFYDLGKEYEFSWDEIPKKESTRFKEFLASKYSIDWIKAAKIEEIDDGKTIKISAEENSFFIKINNDTKEVIFEIDKVRIDGSQARIKNSTLIIFNGEYIKNSRDLLIRILQDACKRDFEQDYSGKILDNPIRSFLENMGMLANPSKDVASFEQELQGRIKRAQNHDQLIAIWKWAENLDPLPPFPLINLAERLSHLNDWESSSNVLKCALKYRPNDFEIHRQLGWHLRHLSVDHEEEALIHFEKALDLNPGDPETYGMMGGLFKRQKKYKEASDCYSKGAANSPNSLYMIINQAAMKILSDPREQSTGIGLYQRLIDHINSVHDLELDEWSEVVLGEAYFAIGEIETAREHFLSAIKKADSPKSLRSAADQLELLGSVGFRSQDASDLIKILRNNGEIKAEEAVYASLPIIIHLSDLHFGFKKERKGEGKSMHRFSEECDGYSQSLSQHMIKEFNSRKSHFKNDFKRYYILISGDLTYNGTANEFSMVEKFLNDICSGMNIDKERVILVPGNHDVNWNLARDDMKNRFNNYLAFLVSFYGKLNFKKIYPKIGDLEFGKSPEPSDILAIYKDPKSSLTIIGLNSCIYENEQHHYGFIGGKQLRTIEDIRFLAKLSG